MAELDEWDKKDLEKRTFLFSLASGNSPKTEALCRLVKSAFNEKSE